jgi:glycosyltransferase involved in cell wall biosynthesis
MAMKVAWFTNVPLLMSSESRVGYNGGGWMNALAEEITSIPNVDLVIFSEGKGPSILSKNLEQRFFLISADPLTRLLNKLRTIFRCKLNVDFLNQVYKRLSVELEKEEFDVIHIWGTEKSFGLLAKYTSIPILIHIQGVLNSYQYYLSPNLPSSFRDYVARRRDLFFWKSLCEIERQVFELNSVFAGRTKWDRSIVELLGGVDGSYVEMQEGLRQPFIDKEKLINPSLVIHENIRLVSVLSPPTYKGIYLIDEIHSCLEQSLNIKVDWTVIGTEERTVGNLKFIGRCSDIEIANIFSRSDIYVHTALIENSPNSICEAQTFGLPIVAALCGGIESLILNRESAILVQPGDPLMYTAALVKIINNYSHYKANSLKQVEEVLCRHNPSTLAQATVLDYENLIKNDA